MKESNLAPTFDSIKFSQFILDNDVYGFFEKPITLKSGRKSHYYANWRKVVSDVWATEKLAEFIFDYALSQWIDPDTYYGVPDGATPVAMEVQRTLAKLSGSYGPGSHTLAMGRAVPKTHGVPRDRYFVSEPQGKIAIIEDVTTTGGSMLESLDFLIESGKDVQWVIGLTNRMELRDDGLSVKEVVEMKGVEYHALSNSIDMLPKVYEKLQPGEHIARAIEQEFEQNGVEPLKLLK